MAQQSNCWNRASIHCQCSLVTQSAEQEKLHSNRACLWSNIFPDFELQLKLNRVVQAVKSAAQDSRMLVHPIAHANAHLETKFELQTAHNISPNK
jgi:hypothetical protein